MQQEGVCIKCGAPKSEASAKWHDFAKCAVNRDVEHMHSTCACGYTWIHPPNDSSTSALAMHLTPRELQIVQGMARGDSRREIASALGVGERTVKLHTSHVFAKLGVHDRATAVLFAVRQGWVKL